MVTLFKTDKITRHKVVSAHNICQAKILQLSGITCNVVHATKANFSCHQVTEQRVKQSNIKLLLKINSFH